MLHGRIHTAFGWYLHVGQKSNPRSLRNFPMQANGAEMLRLALIFATEAGIRVCAPVHDAILIEAPVGLLDAHVARMQELMAKAGEIVLGGFRLRSEVKVVVYPDRYMDERGAKMWNTVIRIMDDLDQTPPKAK
jgi:hypothetical protein